MSDSMTLLTLTLLIDIFARSLVLPSSTLFFTANCFPSEPVHHSTNLTHLPRQPQNPPPRANFLGLPSYNAVNATTTAISSDNNNNPSNPIDAAIVDHDADVDADADADADSDFGDDDAYALAMRHRNRTKPKSDSPQLPSPAARQNVAASNNADGQPPSTQITGPPDNLGGDPIGIGVGIGTSAGINTTTNDNNFDLLSQSSEVRHELAKYIFNELYKQNLSSVMDSWPAMVPPRSLAPATGAAPTLISAAATVEPLSDFGTVAQTSGSVNQVHNGFTSSQFAAAAAVSAAAGDGSAAVNASPLLGSRPYFGDAFYSFQTVYWPIHVVVCLSICTLGIFANVTNIIVLTRPNMITAVNTILSAMAFSDLIVNASNIPYLMHELTDSSNASAFYSYKWALYILFHAHTTVTAHTISIWLTCVLATWRYCVVCFSFSAVLTQRYAPLLPAQVGFSHLADESQFIKTFHFWIFSCLTKLLPCVLLTFFTSALIRKLLNARERRLRLTTFQNHKQEDKDVAKLGVSATPTLLANEKRPKNSIEPVAIAGRLAERANGCIQINGCDNLRAASSQGRNQGVRAGLNSELDLAHHHHCAYSTCSNLQEARNAQELCSESTSDTAAEPQADLALMPFEPRDVRLLASFKHKQHQQFLHETSSHHQQASQLPSGSSCATDAEILHGSSKNSSSQESSDVHTTSNNKRQPRIQSQLIVESTNDAANNTTTSITTVPTKMLTACDTNSNAQLNSSPYNCNIVTDNTTPRHLVKDRNQNRIQEMSSPRSASTCGVFESYSAAGDDNLDCTAGGGVGGRQQLQQSSLTISQNISKNNSTNLQVRDNFCVRGASSTANIIQAPDGLVQPRSTSDRRTSETIVSRGRSVGSTTLAPFQMIKLQATHRQLNQNETTTRLLIAVMIVFLICEFPAGILAALCAILGPDFFDNVYQPMGILTDLLALINSSVNFVLYCFMSTQFRITFYQVVLRCPAPNAPQNHPHLRA